MILKYLEKLEKCFIEEKNSCSEIINELELQLKENQRFIAMLEESDDPYYEAFSPRQINLYQKNKIKELYHEQKEIISQLEKQKESFIEKEEKLTELREVLNYAREEHIV